MKLKLSLAVLLALSGPASAMVVAPAIPDWQDKPICRNLPVIDKSADFFTKTTYYACQNKDGKHWVEVRKNGELLRIWFKDMIEYNEFMYEWRGGN